jgi:hypothetical protein
VSSINCYRLVMAERPKVSKVWKKALAAITGIAFLKGLVIASQLAAIASQTLQKPYDVAATQLSREVRSQDLRHAVSVCEPFRTDVCQS